MSSHASLSFRAPLADYLEQAVALHAAVTARDGEAEWRFKWMHPRFRDRSIGEVRTTTLDLEDAKLLIAREYFFESWADLAAFTEHVSASVLVARFESAADAVVDGDLATLSSLLRDDPELVRARSTRTHHATLLHYVAANGVEGGRQRTPANAVAVATLLLDAGAHPDALADMYDERCTTMSMLVSSAHPAKAGLQVALANTLLDRGAALAGPGSKWQSPVMTALAFGYLDTARALAARSGPLDDLVVAAGLGARDDARRLVAEADRDQRQAALSLAAVHGHDEVVRLLLDAGVDPDAYNPKGFHAHSTPLHQAAVGGHLDVVRTLVERGARLDIEDTIYSSTPLGWALHVGHTDVAEYLRERGASP